MSGVCGAGTSLDSRGSPPFLPARPACRSNVPVRWGGRSTSSCPDRGGNDEWGYNVSHGHFAKVSRTPQIAAYCISEQVPGE